MLGKVDRRLERSKLVRCQCCVARRACGGGLNGGGRRGTDDGRLVLDRRDRCLDMALGLPLAGRSGGCRCRRTGVGHLVGQEVCGRPRVTVVGVVGGRRKPSGRGRVRGACLAAASLFPLSCAGKLHACETDPIEARLPTYVISTGTGVTRQGQPFRSQIAENSSWIHHISHNTASRRGYTFGRGGSTIRLHSTSSFFSVWRRTSVSDLQMSRAPSSLC